MLLGATAALTAVVAAAATAAPPPPWTDDPPQPRGPSWAPGLPSPPLAIDPRNRSALPPSAPFGPYSSADFGLPHNATPGYSTLGDSLYTFGVAVAGRYVYAAPYATHVVHRWDIGTGQQKTIHIKSEFFGRPGTFAIAAAPDGGALYLGLDGDGCMPGNPASRAQPCAMVRRIAADGHERIVLRNLTTPKQMTFDMQGRLYITEEWRRRIVRWDPAHPDLAPEVVVNATDTLAAGQNQLQPVEGVAVATNGDIYFSLYGSCGGAARDPQGRGMVEGVALAAGQVKVKRAASGRVDTVAVGIWRCRGLALHTALPGRTDRRRGKAAGAVLYIVSEANAWDQGSSGTIFRLDLDDLSGGPGSGGANALRLVEAGLDYPQFPAVSARTGRLYASLALHSKVIELQPPPQGQGQGHRGGFAPATSSHGLRSRSILASVRSGTGWAPSLSPRLPPAPPPPPPPPSPPQLTLSLVVEGLNVSIGGPLTLRGDPTAVVEAWVRLPRALLPALYKAELPYNDPFVPGPDQFELPRSWCTISTS